MPLDSQFSFTGGELSESLYGRNDLQKFDSACRTLLNMFVHPEGGASNRAGLKYVGSVTNGSDVRLIGFRYNNTQAYALEFTDLKMRVIRNGGYVLDSGLSITAVSKADPCEITIGSHSYVAGQVVTISGVVGMTELNGNTYIINTVTATTVTLNDLFGNAIDSTSFTTYTSDGLLEAVVEFTTVYPGSDLFSIKYEQNADTITFTHPSYTDMYDITRTDHDTWTITALTFTPAIDAPTGLSVSASTGNSGLVRDYVITAIAETTGEESVASTSDDVDHDISVGTTRSNDLTWTAATGAERYNIYCDDSESGLYGYIGSAENTTFSDKYVEPNYTVTPPVIRTPFTGSGNTPQCLTYHQQRRVYAGATNTPSTFIASRIKTFTNMNVSTITQANDALTFNVLADDVNEIRDIKSQTDLFLFTSSGTWVISSGDKIAFVVENLTSDEQESWGVSDIPVLKVGNSMLYVQDGQKVVRDLQYTFESDKYSGDNLTLLAKHIFEGKKIIDWAYARDPDGIVWCVLDDGTLAGLTYLRQHQVWAWHRHETRGNVLSVCAIPETTSEYGVYFAVQRRVNGNTVIFTERLASRDIFSVIEDSFFVDAGLSYDSPITISGATQADPVVVTATAHGFSDGDEVDIVKVPGMTEINGTRFVVSGATTNSFELQDGDGNDIDGTAYTLYDELLSLRGEGGVVRKAVTTVSGLSHLEGETVSILADGGVETPAVVTGGSVSITQPASRIHVGLPYESKLSTIGVDLTALNGYGDSIARIKTIPEVKIRFKDSIGFEIGASEDYTEPYKPFGVDADEAPALINGVVEKGLSPEFGYDAYVHVKQSNPQPLTVLSMLPEVKVARG